MKFGLVTVKEAIEKRFEVVLPDGVEYVPNYNICKDSMSLVLSSENSNQFRSYHYGLISSGAKNPYKIYHVPIENQKSEHREGILKKDIIQDPIFQKAISQRCSIPVDYFIIEAKDNPYLY